MHPPTHPNTHTHTQTDARTHTHALTNAHSHIQTHTHTDGCTHTHARPYPRALARTHTHTEIRNTYCFPHQRWFRERASMLSYMCIASVVCYSSCEGKVTSLHLEFRRLHVSLFTRVHNLETKPVPGTVTV